MAASDLIQVPVALAQYRADNINENKTRKNTQRQNEQRERQLTLRRDQELSTLEKETKQRRGRILASLAASGRDVRFGSAENAGSTIARDAAEESDFIRQNFQAQLPQKKSNRSSALLRFAIRVLPNNI